MVNLGIIKKEKMTSSTISFNEELALRHRIGEKRLLWMYRDLAMEELHVLEQMSRVVSRRTNESTATSTITMPDRPRFRCESLRALGREVWARWQKVFWYKGHVTAVNILRDDAGVTFNVRFDDLVMWKTHIILKHSMGLRTFRVVRVGDLDGRFVYGSK